MVPMKDTTIARDVFRSLVTALDKAGVHGSSAVRLVVDGAPSMVGRNAAKKCSPQTEDKIFVCFIVFRKR